MERGGINGFLDSFSPLGAFTEFSFQMLSRFLVVLSVFGVLPSLFLSYCKVVGVHDNNAMKLLLSKLCIAL